MSHYTTLDGIVVYPCEDPLRDAVDLLEGDWMTADHRWVDERGEPQGDGQEIDWEEHVLEIPYDSYRNIGHVVPELLESAVDGWVVATTTDGIYRGRCYGAGGLELDVDLIDWGQRELDCDDPPPEDDPVFLEWISDVERAFQMLYSE